MRQTKLWLVAATAVVALVGVALFAGCGKKAEEVAEGATYTCPMHPEVTSDKPGECPSCGMDLVPAEDVGEAEETVEVEETTALTYTCPMHPEVTSDEPGECPTCGMDLVPAEEIEPASGEMPEHGGM